MQHVAALEELREPLIELGRRWAASSHRPRPSSATLQAWDAFLNSWVLSDLPLLLRDSRRRGTRTKCSNGRDVIFGDNSPANWAFKMALADNVPDIASWNADNIANHVPLTFLTKGSAGKRDLNKAGWKVCHIRPVSDRKRLKTEQTPFDSVEAEFRRYISPRNIFLIPISISGAGELPEVIKAIADFEQLAREDLG